MFILRQAGPTLIMSCRAIRALVVCTALVSMPLQAAHRWTGLTTPHFEMYTNNGVGSGTKALETFERVRSFFLDNSPSKHAPDTPVRIIAFKSEREFEPYRPNDGAFAYYQRSRKRDYIVMQDLSSEHYRTAVHVYTHLIVEHSGLKLPIWLNEGLADLYSSMEPNGNQTMVGRPIEGHLIVLGNEKWLDLALLTSVRQDSPYYNERTKMQMFYAESWALTHMLALGKDYQAGFGRFLASVSAGANAETSFKAVYRKTLAQVMADLNGYFQHRTIQVSLFDSKLEKVNLQPAVEELSILQTELALADLVSGTEQESSSS